MRRKGNGMYVNRKGFASVWQGLACGWLGLAFVLRIYKISRRPCSKFVILTIFDSNSEYLNYFSMD
jgi:hypothetical protein